MGCVRLATHFVLLDQVSPDSGLWPLVVSRTAATALVLATALIAGGSSLA
jgi:hypothetical protein